MFESKEELISDLTVAGLGGYAEQIGELAEPCLYFAPLAGPGKTSGNVVRLGGFPEVPPGAGWPCRPALPHVSEFRAWLKDDKLAEVWGTPRPLTLIAQIDLEQAAAAFAGPWPLPSCGRLSLY